jgi:hypothetical protein
VTLVDVTDVVDRAKAELWDYDTYGSFWNGREVVADLIAEVEKLRAERDRAIDEGDWA